MVIDDEATVRLLMQAILETAGYPVRIAGDALHGLKLLEQAPADVVLLDLHLRGANGLQLIPALKALRPAPKIVLLSGRFDSEQDQRPLLAVGAHGIVAKPFETADLLALIRHLTTPSALPTDCQQDRLLSDDRAFQP